MIIGENFLFIHTPKAGGMSFTRWLLNNVDGRLWVVVPPNAFQHSMDSAIYDDAKDRIELVKGHRHETLPEARKIIEQLKLPEPEFVFSAIRDPYDLLHSYYSYIKKPHVMKRRLDNKGQDLDLNLALNNDFETFAQKCGFMGRTEEEIVEYFKHENSFPSVEAVPLNDMANYLSVKFSTHNNFGRYNLEKRNTSTKKVVDPDIKKRIQNKIYSRFHALKNVYDDALKNAERNGHWDLNAKRNAQVQSAVKKTKKEILEFTNELIVQLRKELGNKDVQITALRKELDEITKARDAELKRLKGERQKTIKQRDKEIVRLQSDRSKSVDKRDKEIERLRAKISSTANEVKLTLKGQAKTLKAKDAHIQFMRAEQFIKNEKIEDAIKALKSSIDLNPEQFAANFLLGRAYEMAEDYQNAENSFLNARKIDPKKNDNLDMILKRVRLKLQKPDA